MPDPGTTPRVPFAELHRQLADDVLVWAELQIRPPLRRRLDPEDLAQEIWGRALRGFERFDATLGTFRQWLFGIAWHTLRRQLRDYHRRYRREDTSVASQDSAATITDGRTSVQTRLVRSERVQRLLAALTSLPDVDRQLVQYRGLEGLPHAEVARRLDLTVANVESRWRRLREQVATQLADD